MRVASLAHASSRNSQRDYSQWLMRLFALANTISRTKKSHCRLLRNAISKYSELSPDQHMSVERKALQRATAPPSATHAQVMDAQ